MLYYVKSGDLDGTVRAISHKQAAIKAFRQSDDQLGACMIVSDSDVIDENSYCFLTEAIREECSTIKIAN